MDFENKVPEWGAAGVEPPSDLKSKGFESGYKPPAAYFNWFWNRASKCLTELFSKLKSHAEDKNNPHGTTPEQIGAAKEEHYHMYDEAVITAGTGAEYTATVAGVSELHVGLSFNMVPHVTSTSTTPTLNVNGLGAKVIRRRLSGSTTATNIGGSEGWLAVNKPVYMTFDGTYWIADIAQPNVADLYGILAVAKGGTGASTKEQALINLGINATAAELNYMDGVTSNVQTQLDGKAASSHNHSASNITSGTLPINRGGTGASNGATALKNMFAAGITVLSSNQYGDELPAAGTAGRLFFQVIPQEEDV